MPRHKVPLDVCDYSEDWRSAENYKTESLSSRSSSPKSLTESSESWTSSPISISEASESPEGSIISEAENEADRIANDLDNMKITEIQAEEMMKEGADMRHVLHAAYQLKPKCISKMKFKRGTKLNGRAVMSLLNFDNYKEKEEEVEQKQRMSRAWAEYEQRLNRGKGVKPPPGFESLDQVIEKKMKSGKVEEPEFLVSYANGTNTLTLASQPIVVHDVTVSCVVDSCRVFIQHMKNPTFEGLKNLETELLTTFSMEPAKDLLRPIAQGSVLGVFSDDKWYRCQVVSYNSKQDTCDVKFVDHGGYTTVPASHLRQLKSDFLRLPFQAIEVYLAHVNPSTCETQTDITAEILFHANVSIRLLGQADDGVPMIQAYYYDGDYINIFTQEIINSCSWSQELTHESTTCSSPSSSEAASLEDFPALPTQEDQTVVPEECTAVPSQEDCPSQEAFSPSPEAYPAYPYPTYPYVCPEMGYVQAPVDASQPTFAYCYQDAQGLQQIYYVAGPFIMPTHETSPLPMAEDLPSSTSPSSEDPSDLSFSWSNDVESEESSAASEQEQAEVDLDSKPAEEWTQEDYARYYGL